jgi:exopolyphosphatase/guanosine-5'-triphosphate,3'-diphosphate pyrophosphatase
VRIATIDLGSNTVRLLVADVVGGGTWRVVIEHQTVTRLGEGLAEAGRLGEAAMARTLRVVEDYAGRGRDLGAGDLRIVATSAVREAANGRAFAETVGRATGRPVRVVSGEDEARLTLLGVRRGLGDPAGRLLAFDIGGGSTEYILAREDHIEAATSLRLGVVALAERYPFPAPVDWPRYRTMLGEIRRRLDAELPATIRGARPDRLVGTAGTVTTLAALDVGLGVYDGARVQGHVLTRAAVERLLARLGALDVRGRAALPCLEPGRADLIVAGTAVVQATLDLTGQAALTVSDWGLREGILADAVDRGFDSPPGRAVC